MRKLRYPKLREGVLLEVCPSRDRSRGTVVTDFSPFNRIGTMTSLMAPASSWTVHSGKPALKFDGTDDYVLHNSVPASGTTKAISGWLYWSAFSTFGQAIECPSQGWCFTSRNVYGNYFELGFPGNSTVYQAATTIPTQMEHWYGSFVDGSIYKNGVKQSTTTDTGIMFYGSGNLRLGGGSYDVAQFWPGSMDDIRLYNRSLTPPEISLLALRRGITYETYNIPVVRGATLAGVTGTASQTELPDTQTATATLSVTSSANQTELPDTQTATSSLALTASTSQTELPDTQTVTSSVTITSSANQTELPDTSTESGTILISAIANQVELNDLVNQTGTVGNTNYASATQLELSDTQTATSTLSLTASVSQLELPDNQLASASLLLQGSAGQQEIADVTQAEGVFGTLPITPSFYYYLLLEG